MVGSGKIQKKGISEYKLKCIKITSTGMSICYTYH